MYLQILVIAIFIGATIAHYRKPRTVADARKWTGIWKKIPQFSLMDNGVIYDPRKAHLLAYHFATFRQKFNGEMPGYSGYGNGNSHKFNQMREKAAFKLNDDDGDDNFFILYWWRISPDSPELCTFNNKQSFLDEIYNHWGTELYNQLNENIGCEDQEATVTA